MKNKKHAILEKFPKTFPLPNTGASLYIFKRNKKRNPYSAIVDNFLTRQMILVSHFNLIISVSLGDDLNFYGYFMILRDYKSKRLVTPENRFTINKKNKTIKLKYLKNYLAVSLIAQSFENFEALIKDIYREYLRLNIKVTPALETALKQIPRNNSEIIKILKKLFPSVSSFLTKDETSWIRVMENIRHCVVHTDQLISKEIVNGDDRTLYSKHFSFQKVKDGKYRIRIDLNRGTTIMKVFDNLGFNIFNYASLDSGYPVDLKIEPK